MTNWPNHLQRSICDFFLFFPPSELQRIAQLLLFRFGCCVYHVVSTSKCCLKCLKLLFFTPLVSLWFKLLAFSGQRWLSANLLLSFEDQGFHWRRGFRGNRLVNWTEVENLDSNFLIAFATHSKEWDQMKSHLTKRQKWPLNNGAQFLTPLLDIYLET